MVQPMRGRNGGPGRPPSVPCCQLILEHSSAFAQAASDLPESLCSAMALFRQAFSRVLQGQQVLVITKAGDLGRFFMFRNYPHEKVQVNMGAAILLLHLPKTSEYIFKKQSFVFCDRVEL